MLKLQAYTLDVNKTLMETHLEKSKSFNDSLFPFERKTNLI